MQQFFDSNRPNQIRALALTALMIFIWLILGMVYADRFLPPFERLELWLMPWKGAVPPEAGLDQRLSIMQEQLDASNRVSSCWAIILKTG